MTDEKHIKYIYNNMFRRCYYSDSNDSYYSYFNCSVSDEWKDFDIFYKWYIENYYEIPNEKMCLDKDILVKNNKIYSPNTCCFVPNSINILLTKRKALRGNCPIGVYKKGLKYCSKCKYKNKTYWLGSYDNENDAFLAYKLFKENSIKNIAKEYKQFLPNHVYEALINYEVEKED